MHILYNIFIHTYYLVIRVASVFDKKAALWLKGREKGLDKIALELDHESEHVWFHCASLGEFEQGRPVLERFKADNPHAKIVLTFFSPSGYEIRKNYPLADHVFYMPLDTPANAARFVEYVNPRVAIFVKYEYWYNHMKVLYGRNIPIVFISAIYHKKFLFFKWWGGWFRKQLKKVTYFFVQDKNTQNLLYSIGIHNAVVSGDTRFDRVYDISRKPTRYEQVEKFIQGSVIFMAGSTWPADENILLPLINKKNTGDIKFILVPHEINPPHIDQLMRSIEKPCVKYSVFDEEKFKNAEVLIVDRIGMLSSLYQYASLAYIGGGFGKGIHNVLEAATFGMPVIFGPNYKQFTEAIELTATGGGFPVTNKAELEKVFFSLLTNYELLKESSDIARSYVQLKRGATNTISVFLNTLYNPGTFRARALDMLNMN
ncbi:MAG: 3-deoxy-D-manno-octulosonic acid transferase [Bacteroidota bacterium]